MQCIVTFNLDHHRTAIRGDWRLRARGALGTCPLNHAVAIAINRSDLSIASLEGSKDARRGVFTRFAPYKKRFPLSSSPPRLYPALRT